MKNKDKNKNKNKSNDNENGKTKERKYDKLYFFVYGWLVKLVAFEKKLSAFTLACEERKSGNIKRSEFIKQYEECFEYACRSVESLINHGGEEILLPQHGFMKCSQHRYISKQDYKTLEDAVDYINEYRRCQDWNESYCGGPSDELDMKAEKKILEEFHPAMQRLYKGLNEKAEQREDDKKEKDDLTRIFYEELD